MIDISKIPFTKGLQLMPVMANKRAFIDDWQTTTAEYDFKNCQAVGLVCGKVSGNVEVLDIDLKYDLTGTLNQRFKKLIGQLDKDLLSKMVVQKTVSGGYHFIYRCSFIEGNQRLAARYANDE